MQHSSIETIQLEVPTQILNKFQEKIRLKNDLTAHIFNVINENNHDDPKQYQSQVTTGGEVGNLQECGIQLDEIMGVQFV